MRFIIEKSFTSAIGNKYSVLFFLLNIIFAAGTHAGTMSFTEYYTHIIAGSGEITTPSQILPKNTDYNMSSIVDYTMESDCSFGVCTSEEHFSNLKINITSHNMNSGQRGFHAINNSKYAIDFGVTPVFDIDTSLISMGSSIYFLSDSDDYNIGLVNIDETSIMGVNAGMNINSFESLGSIELLTGSEITINNSVSNLGDFIFEINDVDANLSLESPVTILSGGVADLTLNDSLITLSTDLNLDDVFNTNNKIILIDGKSGTIASFDENTLQNPYLFSGFKLGLLIDPDDSSNILLVIESDSEDISEINLDDGLNILLVVEDDSAEQGLMTLPNKLGVVGRHNQSLYDSLNSFILTDNVDLQVARNYMSEILGVNYNVHKEDSFFLGGYSSDELNNFLDTINPALIQTSSHQEDRFQFFRVSELIMNHAHRSLDYRRLGSSHEHDQADDSQKVDSLCVVLDGASCWIQVFGQQSRQDDIDDWNNGFHGFFTGYKANAWGVIGGAYKNIKDKFLVGTALSYTNLNVEVDHNLGNVESDALHVSAYSAYHITNNAYLLTQLSYQFGDHQTTRDNIGHQNITAKGDYYTHQFLVQADIGYDFHLSDQFTVSPMMINNWAFFESDDYTEKGFNQLNLKIESVNVRSYNVGVGIDSEWLFNLQSEKTIRSNLFLGYLRDVINEEDNSTVKFEGTDIEFETTGIEPDKKTYLLGVAVRYQASENLQLSVEYDLAKKDKYISQAGIFKMSFTF